jgi:hypothetical protein
LRFTAAVEAHAGASLAAAEIDARIGMLSFTHDFAMS